MQAPLVAAIAFSLPVLTIAMDAGFRSLSSFNKAFKEKLGVTPAEYRKSIKKQPISPEVALQS